MKKDYAINNASQKFEKHDFVRFEKIAYFWLL